MYILNIARAIKRVSGNEIWEVIFESYYKKIGFPKENSYYSTKRLEKKDLLLLATKLREKIPDFVNAKEHYKPFIRKRNRKSVKQSEIIT